MPGPWALQQKVLMNISSPVHAFHFFRRRIHREVEEFWAAALNVDKRVLAAECLFRGTVDYCPFHPRDVFRFAYRHNASSLIVAHNHPSGVALPSEHDELVTERLLLAAHLLEVSIDDHLILAGKTYFSFQEHGRLIIAPSPSGR